MKKTALIGLALISICFLGTGCAKRTTAMALLATAPVNVGPVQRIGQTTEEIPARDYRTFVTGMDSHAFLLLIAFPGGGGAFWRFSADPPAKVANAIEVVSQGCAAPCATHIHTVNVASANTIGGAIFSDLKTVTLFGTVQEVGRSAESTAAPVSVPAAAPAAAPEAGQ